MFAVGKGGTSIFGYAGGMLVTKNRARVYANFRREYNTFSVARLGPYDKPIKSVSDATTAVTRIGDLIKAAEFTRKPADSFRLMLLPEFAFNVFDQPYDEFDKVAHGGHSPLSSELVQELLTSFRNYMAPLPPGILLVVGGIAHDTGELLPSGKIKAINLGFVIESGPERPFAMFSKYHPSVIDGWPDKYEVISGTGPVDYVVKDPSGGRPARLSILVCLDAVKGPFSENMEKSDIIAVSSYGVPRWQRDWLQNKRISQYAEVAVADSAPIGAITGEVGVFRQEPVPRNPLLREMHSLSGGSWIADALMWASEYYLGGTEPGFSKVPLTRYADGDLRVTVTQERPLPDAGIFDTGQT